MISVIVPTLGKINENNFKYQLYNNTETIPYEIIFSIPKKNISKLLKFQKFKNIKIFKSKYYNQVMQRLEAIKIAKYDLILQLDDDIFLGKSFITKIYFKSIGLKNNFCLSPIYKEFLSKQSIYKEVSVKKNLISKFFFNVDLKKNSGSITNFGLALDHNPNKLNRSIVEWLPGGCMLTKKFFYSDFSGSIFKNFHKSYYEDVYFSYKSNFIKYLDYRLPVFLHINENDKNNKSNISFYYFYKIFKLIKKKSYFKFYMYLFYKWLI
jgi:hypothetical protein